MTAAEAAKRAKVSPSTITRWLSEGRLVGERHGGRWRITAAALRAATGKRSPGRPKRKPSKQTALSRADVAERLSVGIRKVSAWLADGSLANYEPETVDAFAAARQLEVDGRKEARSSKARKDAADAGRSELALARAQGTLYEKRKVDAIVTRHGAAVVAAITGMATTIPPLVGQQLLAEGIADGVRARVVAAIRHAMISQNPDVLARLASIADLAPAVAE